MSLAMSIAVPAPLSLHPHIPSPWDEDMEALERLARLEAKLEFLAETVDRNREEGKHDRNNLRAAMEQLAAMITEQNDKLGGLLGTMEQVSGAKKTLVTIGAVLSFFGLAGLYQVASWLGMVKHP